MGVCRRVSDKSVGYFSGKVYLKLNIPVTAISIAGHLGLDNLILIYDNNAVTVDGNIDACFSEDTSAKLAAQGWHVIEIDDGSNNVSP
jgi:dihydroxyacetone synthase